MNLKKRISKLEVALRPRNHIFIIRSIVQAQDGKPFGIEKGIQRIHCGARTWLRNQSETEEAFIARARAEILKEDDNEQPRGLAAVHRRRFLADYRGFDA